MHSISIKDTEGTWIRRDVDEETYLYIRQLECYIQFPIGFSKLKELYPERFG